MLCEQWCYHLCGFELLVCARCAPRSFATIYATNVVVAGPENLVVAGWSSWRGAAIGPWKDLCRLELWFHLSDHHPSRTFACHCHVGKAWESATQFADAYRIGVVESKAAMNLLTNVPTVIVSELRRLVTCFSLSSSEHCVTLCVFCQSCSLLISLCSL